MVTLTVRRITHLQTWVAFMSSTGYSTAASIIVFGKHSIWVIPEIHMNNQEPPQCIARRTHRKSWRTIQRIQVPILIQTFPLFLKKENVTELPWS